MTSKKNAFLLAMAGAITIGLGSVAHAQQLNMATITCEQLKGLPDPQKGTVVAWMSGYFNAKAGNTVIDLDNAIYNVGVVAEACQKNPALPVMQVITERMPK